MHLSAIVYSTGRIYVSGGPDTVESAASCAEGSPLTDLAVRLAANGVDDRGPDWVIDA